SSFSSPLSLHDALPIFLFAQAHAMSPCSVWGLSDRSEDPNVNRLEGRFLFPNGILRAFNTVGGTIPRRGKTARAADQEATFESRSEEHTSELQSRGHLV